MKKLLMFILMLGPLFAEVSSIERPNLNLKNGQTFDYLESIEYKVEELVSGLNAFSSIPIEQRQSNFYLNEIHHQLAILISTLERTNDLLDHMIWIQDHKLEERGVKKNPTGRGSGG